MSSSMIKKLIVAETESHVGILEHLIPPCKKDTGGYRRRVGVY